MKKRFSLLLIVCLLAASLASCGNKNTETDTTPSDNTGVTDTTDTNNNASDTTDTAQTENTETDSAGDSNGESDANALLTTVWGSYTEDEKFSVAGGDYNHPVEDAPGAFDITDTASLSSMLVLPETAAADIDDAASLIHMMNANTFTCGAFHVTDSEKVSTVADALRDAISSRHWMCGFPDKFVIITYGQYVVSVFGNEELVNTFRDKFTAAYADAAIAYEEAIS
ncbi:MAG: bacteriocin transport accessory protein [Clostridiales bacterium]|nr:bacteriocin transport accessory protein [Clostridiales bacterium]MDD7773873.1 bacteriocin transport accessory protein [Eubacteriales bacterium]